MVLFDRVSDDLGRAHQDCRRIIERIAPHDLDAIELLIGRPKLRWSPSRIAHGFMDMQRHTHLFEPRRDRGQLTPIAEITPPQQNQRVAGAQRLEEVEPLRPLRPGRIHEDPLAIEREQILRSPVVSIANSHTPIFAGFLRFCNVCDIFCFLWQ